MREAVREAGIAQIRGELDDVEAQLGDLAVLLFVETPDQHVRVQGFPREEGRGLFADDEVVVMRQAQGALDSVVVGEGDVRHATRLGETVQKMRRRVRFAHAELARQPVAG